MLKKRTKLHCTNLFRLEKEIKGIKGQYLEILRIFLSMKKKQEIIKSH